MSVIFLEEFVAYGSAVIQILPFLDGWKAVIKLRDGTVLPHNPYTLDPNGRAKLIKESKQRVDAEKSRR